MQDWLKSLAAKMFEESIQKLVPRKEIYFNPLNAKLNPICHLLALLAQPILHISRIRVNLHDD
jgi:hypothetical protein